MKRSSVNRVSRRKAIRKGGTRREENLHTLENRRRFPPHPRPVALTFPRLSTSTGVHRPQRVLCRYDLPGDRGSRDIFRGKSCRATRTCPFYSNVRNCGCHDCPLASSLDPEIVRIVQFHKDRRYSMRSLILLYFNDRTIEQSE